MVEPGLGQLGREEQRFCPYLAVAKYPFRHFHGDSDDRKHIAEKFWDGGQFKDRGWNIYYIRTHSEANPTPLLLIPKHEVVAFFEEVTEKTGIFLAFPDETKSPGFDIAFQSKGEPRPRFLARLTRETNILDLKNQIPTEDMASEQHLGLDYDSLASFQQRVELAYLAGRNDAQAQRDRKKKNCLQQKGRLCAHLRRTQRYLGVRPQQSAEEASGAIIRPPLDIKKPVPYLFNLNVIFICVDIEAYERDSKKLTEIGISTLDTLDIIKTPPGEDGIGWVKHMRSRHFRVADYAHLVNRHFVQGCPDHFMQVFGTSEWISVNEIPKVVMGCFQEPYSAPGHYFSHPTSRQDCQRYGSNIEPPVHLEDSPTRNIILVGHEIRSDIGYLRSIGVNVGKLDNIVEAVDTIDLWRAWKHETKALKLSRILYELGVDAYHLHNAGNDAAYTMQALLGMIIASLDPARRTSTNVPVDPSDDAAPDDSERRIEDEAEWAYVEAEAGDGGKGLSISDLEFDMSMAKESRARARASKGNTASNQGQYSAQSDPHGPSSSTNSGPVYKQPEQAKSSKPKSKPKGLSQQMQKRLVIMDNEEYGA